MFATAKSLTPKKPSARKVVKDEVSMDGLLNLAKVSELIKALQAVEATLDAAVKADAMEHFVAEGNGKRPDNFTGIEGEAKANIQLKVRSSRSVLKPEEVDQLSKLGIPVETLILTPKLFGINPAYAEDSKLLSRVEAALKDIVPEDFIVVQEEKSVQVATDKSIDVAFAKKHSGAVVGLVTTLAIKPTLENVDIEQILADVKELLV